MNGLPLVSSTNDDFGGGYATVAKGLQGGCATTGDGFGGGCAITAGGLSGVTGGGLGG